jgi:hypothetical protein
MLNKKNLIKVYALIGLLAVFLTTGYFRFFEKPEGVQARQNIAPVSVIASPRLTPPVRTYAPQPADRPHAGRDIFAPSQMAERSETAPGEKFPMKATGLKAKGTITGSGRPVAVINDSFVREGDTIGEYRVIKIKKSEVVLKSSSEHLVLEVLDNAEK